ncbi:MAG: hypothetical protein EXS24_01375 [Pedosphaera sp.]|nr:hypothetical protein [Pedosphaera sp.]
MAEPLNADKVIEALRKAVETGEPASAEMKRPHGVSFMGKDLSGLDLSDCDFSGCEMSRCNLTGVMSSNVKFDGATLFQANLEGSEFMTSSFKNANLDECQAKRTGLGSQCDFTGATFRRANLEGTSFTTANLTGANFQLAKMPKSRLQSANLSHVEFSQADMTEADMRESNIAHAAFNKTCLRAVQLRGVTNYISAYWIGADIRDIDFAGAYLVRRHISDENYLDEFQKQSDLHKKIYWVWWLSSDCGRSLFRWAVLQAGVVAIFGLIFYSMNGSSAGVKADKPLAESGLALPISNGVFTVNGVRITIDAATHSFNDIAALVAKGTTNQVTLSYDSGKDLVNFPRGTTFAEDEKSPSNFTVAARLTQDQTQSSYWNNTDRRVGVLSPDFAIPGDLVRSWYTPQYYAVVAATTLGFGDVLPKSTLAQILTNLLTIFGYFGLGGLMTILGNLLGRRGE